MAYTYNPLSGNFDYYKTYSSSDFDHGGLAGLSDDDHTQYALLAGRSSGQTLIGGTTTTADLTFQTTSGVGTTGADMHFLVGNNGATEAMTINNAGVILATKIFCVGQIQENLNSTTGISVWGDSTIMSEFISTINSSASGGAGLSIGNDDGAAMGSGHRLGFILFKGNRGDGTLTHAPGIEAYTTELWTTTGGGSKLVFSTTPNGSFSRADRVTIGNDGSVGIGLTAPAQLLQLGTGSTTVHHSLSITAGQAVIFNETGIDLDFRVESDNQTHMLFVDASLDLVGIGSSAPNSRLDIRGSWTATAANNGAFKIDSTIDDGGFNLQAIQLSPTIDVNASGTNQVIRAVPTVRPVTNITGTYMGLNNNLTIGGSSANTMTTVIANNATVVRGGSYTGVITTLMAFRADAPASWALGQVTNYTGYQAATATIGNGLTTGTLTLRGLQVQAFSAAAAGGAITAYGIEVTVPSGNPSSGTNTSRGIYITGNGGASATKHALYSDSTADSFLTGNLGIGVSTPASLLDVSSTTGGILTLSRNDTTATAADVIGKVQFWNNDTQLTTQNIYADIEVQAFQTVTTDAAAGKMIIRTTGTGAAGSPEERITLVPTETVINDGGLDKDFRVESDNYDALFVDAGNDATHVMNNASGKLSFFAVTAVTRQTELTDELTTITFTAPGTPDYAIQDLTAGGFGFVTADEGNTVLSVIANLQARVNELETKLVAYGLLQDSD